MSQDIENFSAIEPVSAIEPAANAHALETGPINIEEQFFSPREYQEFLKHKDREKSITIMTTLFTSLVKRGFLKSICSHCAEHMSGQISIMPVLRLNMNVDMMYAWKEIKPIELGLSPSPDVPVTYTNLIEQTFEMLQKNRLLSPAARLDFGFEPIIVSENPSDIYCASMMLIKGLWANFENRSVMYTKESAGQVIQELWRHRRSIDPGRFGIPGPHNRPEPLQITAS